MTQNHRAALIKQARHLICRTLEIVYDSPMNFRHLYQTLCTVDKQYDEGLLAKDLAYLTEKGYIECTSGKLAGSRTDPLATFKLTAAGLEVAQCLITDPALEI